MGRESYEIGRRGEEAAVDYLQQKGFEILQRNFHSSQGEIDIIAKDRDFLVFTEVKNYSFRSYGSPVGAIRKSKKQSLIHAAEAYLYKNNVKDTYCRFDVIAIYTKYNGQKIIEHYKDAFYVS